MASHKIYMIGLSIICASALSLASAQNSNETIKKVEPTIADSTSVVDVINNDSTSTIAFYQPQELNERIINLPKIEEPKKVVPKKKVVAPKKEEEVKKGKVNITEGKRVSYTIIAFNKANERDKARAIAQQINSKFPGYRARVTSNLPYWQVSVGPFFDKGDASKAASKIRSSISGTTPSIREKNIVITR